MVVYTPLSLSEAAPALKDYPLAEVLALRELHGGTTNSNFKVETGEGDFVLTLLEPAEEAAQISWLPSYLEHLKAQGLPVPCLLKTHSGKNSTTIKSKTAIVVPLLKGRDLPPAAPCAFKAGNMLAAINLHSANMAHKAPSPWGLEALMAKMRHAQPDSSHKEILPLLRDELEEIQTHAGLMTALPQGIAHTDFFPDNVLFEDERVSGVIDFYKAGHDALAYDLAMGLAAWGFDDDNTPMPAVTESFYKGYTEQRPLRAAEQQAMPLLLRRACCTIILMRILRSQMTTKSDITPRSPTAFAKRLQFFKDNSWEDITNG